MNIFDNEHNHSVVICFLLCSTVSLKRKKESTYLFPFLFFNQESMVILCGMPYFLIFLITSASLANIFNSISKVNLYFI